MGKRHFWLALAFFAGQSLIAKDIVVGIEHVPKRNYAVLFSPVVLPDLFSAKAAFEYRVHDKFNLVFPVEAKWMDYKKAIDLIGRWSDAPPNMLDMIQNENNKARLAWKFDFLQFKISAGVGAKYFPFSQAMTDAFFIKSLAMAGYEHFYSYGEKEKVDDAVFTGVLTLGYMWVYNSGFAFGFEGGGEYTWHTNPIKGLPMLINGFMPILQFSLGFTI